MAMKGLYMVFHISSKNFNYNQKKINEELSTVKKQKVEVNIKSNDSKRNDKNLQFLYVFIKLNQFCSCKKSKTTIK